MSIESFNNKTIHWNTMILFEDVWDFTAKNHLPMNSLLQMRAVNIQTKNFIDTMPLWHGVWQEVKKLTNCPESFGKQLTPFEKVKNIYTLFIMNLKMTEEEMLSLPTDYASDEKSFLYFQNYVLRNIDTKIQNFLMKPMHNFPFRTSAELNSFTITSPFFWFPCLDEYTHLVKLTNEGFYYKEGQTPRFQIKYLSLELNKLCNLKILKLENCKIKNLTSFPNLINLQELAFNNNKIIEINLGFLPNLIKLDLQQNPLKEISFYKGKNEVPNLKYLNLNGCKNLTLLSGLADLSNLIQINMQGALKFNFNDLHKIVNLRYATVENSPRNFFEHYKKMHESDPESVILIYDRPQRGAGEKGFFKLPNFKYKLGVKQQRDLHTRICKAFLNNMDALDEAKKFYSEIQSKKEQSLDNRQKKAKAKKEVKQAEAKSLKRKHEESEPEASSKKICTAPTLPAMAPIQTIPQLPLQFPPVAFPVMAPAQTLPPVPNFPISGLIPVNFNYIIPILPPLPDEQQIQNDYPMIGIGGSQINTEFEEYLNIRSLSDVPFETENSVENEPEGQTYPNDVSFNDDETEPNPVILSKFSAYEID